MAQTPLKRGDSDCATGWDSNPACKLSVRCLCGKKKIQCALTDGVSGPGRINGDGKRTEAQPVLGSHSEQVVLSLQEAWDNEGLTGAGRIHLMDKKRHRRQVFIHTIFSIRLSVFHFLHLCPGLVGDTFFLNVVAFDSLSTIVVGQLPDQSHG